jgi:hypothetical protein
MFIGQLVRKRLLENEATIKAHPAFAKWDQFTADAQLGVMSMCWAVGCGKLVREFPKFLTAISREDWMDAARECDISTVGNPGIAPRNAANAICFVNASLVIDRDLDPEVLHFPSRIKGGA